MPISQKIVYELGDKNFITFGVYKTRDLISISPEFKKNRKFCSWKEVFYEQLYAQREKIKYKKRSYDQLSNRFPPLIVNTFLDLLCEDLIVNDAEFILNPKAKQENQFILKVGYVVKIPSYRLNRKTWIVYPYGGMHYLLRVKYPRNWPFNHIPRMAYFERKFRKKMWKELNKGHRYFNSTKEKIFHKLSS